MDDLRERAAELRRLIEQTPDGDALYAVLVRRAAAEAEEREPEWGALLRASAIPRRLDAGVMGALRDAPDDAEGNRAALARLAGYTFVAPAPDGASFSLHEEARAALLAEWRAPERRAEYERLSRALWQHYRQRPDGVLEALYHRFVPDPAGAFGEFEWRFGDAHQFYRRAECQALLLAAEEQAAELDDGQRLWLRYYRARLARLLDRWAEAEEQYRALLEELGSRSRLPKSLRLRKSGEKLRTWTLHDLGMALRAQSKWAEAVEVYRQVLDGLRAMGDRRNEGATLNNLGMAYEKQGQWGAAIEAHEQARDIFRELGDRHGEGLSLMGLGNVYRSQGRWEAAIAQYEQSLAICREMGDRHGEGQSLMGLGNVYDSQGRWGEAIEMYEQSLAIFRELGDRHGEGLTLNNLGNVYQAQGQWEAAIECYEQDLAICRELSDRHGEGQTLNNLGNVYRMGGQWAEARRCFDESLPIRRELGDRLGESYVLHNLGEWHKDQGQLDEAEARYREALAIRRELAAWAEAGATCHALAEVATLRGDWAQAARWAREAAEAWERLAATGDNG